MGEIVRVFYGRTGEKLRPSTGWQFMMCMKKVRLKRKIDNGGDMTDTLVDLISYTALLAECITKKAPYGALFFLDFSIVNIKRNNNRCSNISTF